MKQFLFALTVLSTVLASAQEIQVNRQNKTIAVTAEESATADAEVAVLDIGYHNYAPTDDAAYRENLRASEQILKALLDAKIPKENIQTEKLRLTRAEVVNEKWTVEMIKQHQFTAQQSWHVIVPAPDAQAIVDLAAKAGANEIDDVEWNVKDPVALQAKAGATALAKARTVADQMAKGLGAKLGDLVYASNRAPVARMFPGVNEVMVESSMSQIGDKQPKLRLFPQRVKSEATVYAVFSIE
jgi:uncharacterized protein